MIARVRASDGPGWYLTDHLGTVREIANAAGIIIRHSGLSSFGHVRGIADSHAGDRFFLAGREWDEEWDLYYYRARYFSPWDRPLYQPGFDWV